MKKVLTLAAFAVSLSACAALPSLSGLADQFNSLSERYAEMTNRLADTQTRLAATTNIIAKIAAMIEHEKGLREAFHGGNIGQYVIECGVITNGNGRIVKNLIRIDLYADGSVHTNAAARYAAIIDPEASAKAVAEAKAKADAIQAAWERANLPPALAAIREAQRQAAQTQTVTVVVEGN